MSKKESLPKVKFKVMDNNVWMLEMVRVSYPNLWKPGKYDGAEKPNLDTSFLIPKEQADLIKSMKKEMMKLAKSMNGKIKKLSQIKHLKLVPSKSNEEYYVLKTSNSFEYPPVYIDRNGRKVNNPLDVGADRELYAGCYARVKIQMNPDIVSGKVKVWSNLLAIQFMAHGERFGNGLDDDELSEGFDAVETEDDFDEVGVDDANDEDDFEDDIDDDDDDDDDGFDDDDDFDLD